MKQEEVEDSKVNTNDVGQVFHGNLTDTGFYGNQDR